MPVSIMRLLACAVLAAAVDLSAQCAGAPASQTLSTRAEFVANFSYGPYPPATTSLVQYSDWTINAPIAITSMSAVTYDQGLGVPNQVGATAVVNIYTCATTWTGNQLLNPTTNPPGAPWTLAGTGQITVVAWPAESPITFATPVALTPGTYGVAIEWLATTNGPNPGALHTLGVSPNGIPTASDQFVSITNQGIQHIGWTSGVNTAGLDLRVTYSPAASAGYFAQFGDGCYFHPRAFYEDFPASPTPPDLQNTGIQMLLGASGYLVFGTGPSTIIPAGTPLTTGPFTGSSSGSWDDAYLVQTLPFANPFPYPGGSTNVISIGSNGSIYLDMATSTTIQTCGACYGSIAPFRDEKPRICAYFHDLDPTAGGGIFYHVDPAIPPQYVAITWSQLPEYGVPGAVNTMQMKLLASGDVVIAYGALANQSAGNNAIAGFTPGNGDRLPPAQDLSTTMPFQSGDGATPPLLSMSARPVLGTTPNLVTTDITPGTIFAFVVTGFGTVPAGASLAAVGMPGCRQYISPVSSIVLQVLSGQVSAPLGIPNNAAYLGLVVAAQSAPLTPGLNAGGIVTSNGLCMRVGL